MDPRHPEQAITRMRELMEQYDRVEKDMHEATVSAKLAQLEREGALVVQEICLVAPRMHEALMQTSRQCRHDLVYGAVKKDSTTEPVEVYVAPNQAEVYIAEPKPRKKKTSKKKAE